MKKILLALLLVGIATTAVQTSHISNAEALKAQAAKSKEAANKLLLKNVNRDDLEGIEFALKMGADVNAALEDAIIMGANSKVVKKLLAMLDINLRPDALLIATSVGNVDTINDILNAKADINASDSDEWTALMVAADNNYGALASFLLAKGAYIDAQNKNGTTPLMFAAANNSENLINMLLKKGADVTLEDNKGKTAADYIKIDASDSESYRKRKASLKQMLQKRIVEARREKLEEKLPGMQRKKEKARKLLEEHSRSKTRELQKVMPKDVAITIEEKYLSQPKPERAMREVERREQARQKIEEKALKQSQEQ